MFILESWFQFLVLLGRILLPSTLFSNGEDAYQISAGELQHIRSSTSQKDLLAIFNHINVPRPVGSSGHTEVRKFIVNFLKNLTWDVEFDSFSDQTIVGNVTFHNIIARLKPERPKNFLLACHYESKLMDNFLGSTDSAMPCSIILKIAESLTKYIERQCRADVGLKLVFFDGEEAFREWTSTDSLYGSRHLAAKWDQPDANGSRELSRIKLMILLDLIGASESRIPYYEYRSSQFYGILKHLQDVMGRNNLLRGSKNGRRAYFGDAAPDVFIQDDHLPFWERSELLMVPSTSIKSHKCTCWSS
ncbi:unnamed protein product [Calicophoron daubneyi]|uniref:glutaminyl-peptide cyclotransferase n=1 Tax=Calicophoron daubneyi TaxID=300641 RepID=A0AAV2T174_CALDB